MRVFDGHRNGVHRPGSVPGAGLAGLRRPGRGFTLIELLVVISIIALLIGILVPSLAAARASSRRLKCQSNMASIVKGLVAYEGEMNRLPKRFVDGGPIVVIEGRSQTQSYGYDDELMKVNAGHPRIFVCPDHTKNNYFSVDAFAQPSYGFNWYFDLRTASADSDRTPILLAETDGSSGFGSHKADRNSEDPGQLAPKRHLDKAHYGFADAHVELTTWESASGGGGQDRDNWGRRPTESVAAAGGASGG